MCLKTILKPSCLKTLYLKPLSQTQRMNDQIVKKALGTVLSDNENLSLDLARQDFPFYLVMIRSCGCSFSLAY